MTPPTTGGPLDPGFDGEWELQGQLTTASNATFLVKVGERLAVYKPIRGERPLVDFPDHTLARREIAAYRLSRDAGFDLVPATIPADGPFGPGSLQAWVTEAEQDLVEVIDDRTELDGRLPVIEGIDAEDNPVRVVHRDTTRLRDLTLFDLLANNADRKGGHILLSKDGDEHSVFGVDHGICFHTEDKVRTVLWGFARQEFSSAQQQLLRNGREAAAGLSELLSPAEVEAIIGRADTLLAAGVFPQPVDDRFPYPLAALVTEWWTRP